MSSHPVVRAAAPPPLRVVGVAKAFGPTEAIRNATLEVRAAEVHCIVGENGSGKSTLVKILAGAYSPDAGRLEVWGRSVRRFRSPARALHAGIATVFQEVLVVESRSVLDNVCMGEDGLFRSHLSTAERRQRARVMLDELLGREIPLDVTAEGLSLSDRQACSVARALLRQPQVLILDEATSALDIETRDRLFGILRRLAAAGTATIFISHRMGEIAEIGDRCTVMRTGETVATLQRGEASEHELVRLMTGSTRLTSSEKRPPIPRAPARDIALRVKGLRLSPTAAPIDFTLRVGELVGLAGLEGQGQDAFIKALWGLGPDDAVFVDDQSVSSPRQATRLGISYVPRERRAESIFDSKSIRENFALPTLSQDRRLGLIAPAASRRRLAAYVEPLRIKLGSPEQPITTLSGGNQQKVIVARWLASQPRVLLLNDTTRGVDIAAKRDLYRLLEELTRDGVAVVMLSTEVDEHVELMDRVLVFRERTVLCELSRAELGRERLVAAYFGRSETIGVGSPESINA